MSGVEGVAEEGFAAGSSCAQGVEELEMRRVGGVEQVHVQAEELGRIGDVLGFDFRADIPCAAVEGVFQGAYSAGNVNDGLFRLGHVLEEEHPVLVQMGQPIEECLVASHPVFVVYPFVVLGDLLLVPQHSFIMAHACPQFQLGVQRPPQPVDRVPGAMLRSISRHVILPLDLDY